MTSTFCSGIAPGVCAYRAGTRRHCEARYPAVCCARGVPAGKRYRKPVSEAWAQTKRKLHGRRVPTQYPHVGLTPSASPLRAGLTEGGQGSIVVNHDDRA
jgi:hypothetical protein